MIINLKAKPRQRLRWSREGCALSLALAYKQAFMIEALLQEWMSVVNLSAGCLEPRELCRLGNIYFV